MLDVLQKQKMLKRLNMKSNRIMLSNDVASSLIDCAIKDVLKTRIFSHPLKKSKKFLKKTVKHKDLSKQLDLMYLRIINKVHIAIFEEVDIFKKNNLYN